MPATVLTKPDDDDDDRSLCELNLAQPVDWMNVDSNTLSNSSDQSKYKYIHTVQYIQYFTCIFMHVFGTHVLYLC